ncbi:MAG: HAD family hydrolase [Gemmatimonadota bacterium]
MGIKAVLWDLDGTLISTRRLYLEAYRRALAPYIGRVLTDEEILGYRSRSEIQFLKSQARDQFDACMREFQQYYSELHESLFGGVYPGVRQALAEIRRRGLLMGIVTGKSRSSYEVGLTTAELGQFDVLVMADDVEEPKPHPGGIAAAIQTLGVSAEEVVYVGDSITDMEAAQQAGTAAAAALWSRAEPERGRFVTRLSASTGVHLLDEPADVLSLL